MYIKDHMSESPVGENSYSSLGPLIIIIIIIIIYFRQYNFFIYIHTCTGVHIVK